MGGGTFFIIIIIVDLFGNGLSDFSSSPIFINVSPLSGTRGDRAHKRPRIPAQRLQCHSTLSGSKYVFENCVEKRHF